MNSHNELNKYLEKLDKLLLSLPVDKRSEIILEVKAQLSKIMQDSPQKSFNTILNEYGTPQKVARKFSEAHGVTVNNKKPISFVKWMVIGFLGTTALCITAFLILVWKFTPIIDVDEATGRVKLFGGAIDLQESSQLQFDKYDLDFSFNKHALKGDKPISSTDIKEIEILFNNGSFQINTSSTEVLVWDCKSMALIENSYFQEQNSKLAFNFKGSGGIKCDIELPSNLSLNVVGNNGKIELNDPAQPTTVTLNNGSVEITPDHLQNYAYDLKVTVGKVEEFISSQSPNSIPIKVRIQNGSIEND